ncbi:hypothetical protein P8452_37335 [Trifolium repens]|nr:hypothetical protein P8452_37335 [Trifolium repens]
MQLTRQMQKWLKKFIYKILKSFPSWMDPQKLGEGLKQQPQKAKYTSTHTTFHQGCCHTLLGQAQAMPLLFQLISPNFRLTTHHGTRTPTKHNQEQYHKVSTCHQI